MSDQPPPEIPDEEQVPESSSSAGRHGHGLTSRLKSGYKKAKDKTMDAVPDSVKDRAEDYAKLLKERAEDAAEKLKLREKLDELTNKLNEYKERAEVATANERRIAAEKAELVQKVMADRTEIQRKWAAEHASELAEKTKQIAEEKASLLKELAEEKAKLLKELSIKEAEFAKEKASLLSDRAKVIAEEKAKLVKEYAEKQADDLRGKLNQMLEEKLDSALDRVSVIVKKNAKDPLMPNVVKSSIDGAIDLLWPDVKEEVAAAVMSKLRRTVDPPEVEQLTWSKNPFRKMRAVYLYTLLPYNRSIWAQLRNPLWFILTLISAIPRWGIPQIFYLLRWLLMDKRDEFQLIKFILGFKGIQFLSLGVINAVIGGIQYYLCINFPSHTTATDPAGSACGREGPRQEPWTLIFFAIQILLVYISYMLLPCSLKKGELMFKVSGKEAKYDQDGDGTLSGDELRAMREGKKHKDDDNGDANISTTTKCCGITRYRGRGGRLLPILMIYDFIIFLMCVGMIVAAWIVALDWPNRDSTKLWDWPPYKTPEYWEFSATIYWIMILYGVLSFPFVIFKVPVLNTILVHARMTGYGPNGETRAREIEKGKRFGEDDVVDQV